MSVPEIGVAQLGPIASAEAWVSVVKRLLALQHCVADRRCTIAEGCALLVHSSIIAPTEEFGALSSTLGDEPITATADLDRCAEIRDPVFNFALHRQSQHYGVIVEMPDPVSGSDKRSGSP